jgi:hypothetical protein
MIASLPWGRRVWHRPPPPEELQVPECTTDPATA